MDIEKRPGLGVGTITTSQNEGIGMSEGRSVREIELMWIPMPDGTRLAARVILPDDAEAHPVPAILEYIPYRRRDATRDGDNLTHPWFAQQGYACVRLDIRGTGDSEGVIRDEYLKQEQDDAVAAIAWIAKQPWCTGKVGMMGISWGGFNSLQVAARRPPALKAIVTVCSTDDRYADDMHYMGGCIVTDTMAWGTSFFGRMARAPDPLMSERTAGVTCGASASTAGIPRSSHGSAIRRATSSGGTAPSARTTPISSARSSPSAAGPTATPTPSSACSRI